MTASAWFIGSITIPATTITVAATPVVIPAGSYYLRSATAALSLIDVVATEIDDALANGASIAILSNRIITMSFDVVTSVTWGAGTQIRDLLGFTGNLAGDDTYTAEGVSPLLWSPGYLATPSTIEGVTGYTVPHQSVYKSADGSQVYADHFSDETWQELEWTHIMPERMRVATGTGGGTFHEFFQQCAMLRRRFLYHQSINELTVGFGNTTWDTALGPYVLREDFNGDWYRRNVPYADVSSPLTLPLQAVDEYA